jgi:uncharacterized membrane protein YedE/YeeE
VSRWHPHLRLLGFGLALGLVLGQAGFTDYGEIRRMFLLEDGRLLATYLGGVGVAGLGFALVRARLPPLPRRPVHAGTIPGGLLFGAGWALTGGCPGVLLVQLGEGKAAALATGLGVVAGTWLCQRFRERVRWDTGTCVG